MVILLEISPRWSQNLIFPSFHAIAIVWFLFPILPAYSSLALSYFTRSRVFFEFSFDADAVVVVEAPEFNRLSLFLPLFFSPSLFPSVLFTLGCNIKPQQDRFQRRNVARSRILSTPSRIIGRLVKKVADNSCGFIERCCIGRSCNSSVKNIDEQQG